MALRDAVEKDNRTAVLHFCGTKPPPEICDAADEEDGLTPLLVAAYHDHSSSLAALIDAGVDLEATSEGGMTALHWASSLGHAKVATTLSAAMVVPSSSHVAPRTCKGEASPDDRGISIVGNRKTTFPKLSCTPRTQGARSRGAHRQTGQS